MSFTINTLVLLSSLYLAGVVEFASLCETAPVAQETALIAPDLDPADDSSDEA